MDKKELKAELEIVDLADCQLRDVSGGADNATFVGGTASITVKDADTISIRGIDHCSIIGSVIPGISGGDGTDSIIIH